MRSACTQPCSSLSCARAIERQTVWQRASAAAPTTSQARDATVCCLLVCVALVRNCRLLHSWLAEPASQWLGQDAHDGRAWGGDSVLPGLQFDSAVEPPHQPSRENKRAVCPHALGLTGRGCAASCWRRKGGRLAGAGRGPEYNRQGSAARHKAGLATDRPGTGGEGGGAVPET